MKAKAPLILSIALLLGLCADLRAAVVYTDEFVVIYRSAIYNGGDVTHDFDGDGRNDLRLRHTGPNFTAERVDGAHVLTEGLITASGIFSSYAVAFSPGELIGLRGSDTPTNELSEVWWDRSLVHACIAPTQCYGYFSGGDWFLGVRFLGGDDQIHFGYAQFHVNTGPTGGSWVPILEGYAWETEPDTPILAGAVPEPSGAALALAAAAALALNRRRTT